MSLEQLPAAARIATETALREAGRRRWLGKSINRVEDPRFLRGEGRYIDDISLPGMHHVVFVRSPHPHARIRGIDTKAAAGRPGVVAVVTGRDLVGKCAPVPVASASAEGGQTEGAAAVGRQHYALSLDRVRHVGEAVAAVVATSEAIAADAAA